MKIEIYKISGEHVFHVKVNGIHKPKLCAMTVPRALDNCSAIAKAAINKCKSITLIVK